MGTNSIDLELADDAQLMDAVCSAVPQLLEDSRATIVSARFHPVPYRISVPTTETLRRIRGTAESGGKLKDWSLFLKSIRSPPGPQPPDANRCWDWWQREEEAYRKRVLPRVDTGFGGAAFFGAIRSSSGVHLLLEDVPGIPAARWSVERHGRCSYHLGQFHARSIVDASHPHAAWLENDWTNRYLHRPELLAAVELLGDDALWAAPLAQIAFPDSDQVRDQVRTVWSRRADLLEGLRAAPRTINQNDLWPPNLFSVDTEDGRERSVVVDLSWVAAGALGQDIASLVLDSVYEFHRPLRDLEQLEDVILREYMRGLQSEGWAGDFEAVRFAYQAYSGLRFGIETMQLLRNLTTREGQQDLSERFGRRLEDIARDAGAVVRHALRQGLFAIGTLGA